MDNLYYHQSMKEPIAREFRKYITKEVNDRIKQTKMGTNPKRTSAKRRTNTPIYIFVQTKEVHQDQTSVKKNACLDTHIRKQYYASNFFKTFSPVMNWIAIGMILVI